MIEEKEKLQEISEFERTNEFVAGLALTIGGVSLTSVGLIGIDAYEAKTPSDAFMSTSLEEVGIDEHFVTVPDVGFGLIASLGIIASYKGLSKLFNRTR